MTQRLSVLFLAFAVSISACGTVKGNAPGRADTQPAVPYDATHLDPGNVDQTGIGDSGNAFDAAGGPHLVP